MPDSKEEIKVQEEQEREVYVGPRPFERSERRLFFGRDREISELLSLVTSSRVVLCYAPSGAGKTSLINAGLQPRLEKEGFEVLPPTRVRGLIPEGIDPQKISNVYMFNALLSLAGETRAPSDLTGRSMADFLSTLPHQNDEEGFPAPRILIFDQFEELITSYPELWQEREGFFHQVYDALQADPLLRVLFIMREDFLARIEPFTRLLKPLSQSRFRLDLLGPEGAQAAVTGPLRGTGKRFKEGVVATLIEELLKVRVEAAQGESTEVVGEYVEPVQLQVVCRTLWMSLPPDVQEISLEHLKAYGNVDQALREFYESCLRDAKTDLHANEANLREWFDHQLITPAGTRGIVFRDAQSTAGLPNAVVDFLENRHLIRGEWRAGSRWYELTHDRFIEPIQRANERWRAKRQTRTNRLLTTIGIVMALVLVVWFGLLSVQQSATSQSVSNVTQSASTSVAAQTSVAVIATSAQEDISLSKSRQLAAQALLADDPNVSLLLAIEANRNADTSEARRSLHKVLSKQAVVDGKFLQQFNPDIISPTLVQRLENQDKNWVVSVAFSPDGRRFVSGGQNATLILWDAVSAKPVFSLTGHKSNIESVAFSPDGQMIASAGLDSQILLWNASTGKLIGDPLLGHVGMVTCIAFSPDGTQLASGGADGTIRIWDLSKRKFQKVVQEPAEVWDIAWSPDGKTLAAASAGDWVRLLDTETLTKSRVLKGASDLVRSVAWSPDSRTLAAGIANEEGKPSNGAAILWDVDSLEIIAKPISQISQGIRAVEFDPSGKTLAIGQDDGTITLWDVLSQQNLGNPFKAHNHRVMSIAFSPDGQSMISGSIDGTVALWNLKAPTRSIAVSPKGDLLATSQGAAISLWDLSNDQTALRKILSGHTDDVLALAFSPDGNTLVSSGRDNTVRFWDVHLGQQSGASLPTLSNVSTLQFSPDGSTLAVAGEDGKVQLFDPATSKLHTLMEQNAPIIKLQFGEGGKTLQAAGKDGTLFTWDLTSNAPQVSSLPGAQRGIVSVAFSPDGQRVSYFLDGATAFLQDEGRAQGIEISFFDQSFDPTVNPNGVNFIIVKASEGVRVDRKFEEFLQPVQSVPIRGALHIFSEKVPWQQQADFFLSTVKDKGFQFYALYLFVNPSNGSTQFLADAEQWLKYVQSKVQGKVLLETASFYLSKFGPAGDWMKDWPVVVAQYPFQFDPAGNPLLPQGFKDWKFWNYSDKGNGAEYGAGTNNTILDLYNGTPVEMSNWLGSNPLSIFFSIYEQSSGNINHPTPAVQVTSPNGIAFSPDGSYLAIAGDGMVSLLNATSGEEISTLAVEGRTVLSINFMPNSDMLVVGTDDGTIFLWDLSFLKSGSKAQSMIGLACSQAQRNLTQSEWVQYIGANPYRATCRNFP